MGRKRKKRQLRCFVFSPETIKLLQEAMKRFSQSLTRAEDQPEKVAFAREMVQQINEKLDTIRTSVGVMCLTNFDFNEKIVIVAAMHLYMLEPLAASASLQREKELKRCQQILHFALDPGRESGQ